MNGESPERTQFRLLIVADHGLVREGLVALFRAAGEAKPAATGAQEVLWAIEHFRPRVVLLDAAMADADPFSAARFIADRFPEVRLLFLDDAVRPEHLRAALSVRASGYWTKRASLDQLAEALRRIVAGGTSFCPTAQKYLGRTADALLRLDRPTAIAGPASLTPREREVLTLLADGHTVRQCAERLGVSPGTIDSHKRRIMKKLGVRRAADLVRLAVRDGVVELRSKGREKREGWEE